MLLIIYGPTGTGKTTTMRVLAESRGWQFLPGYATRPEREAHKTVLSRESLLSLKAAGKAALVNEHFGALYAVDAEALEASITSLDSVWMQDFALANRTQVCSLPLTVEVILLPESESALRQQLLHAERVDRIEFAVEDLRHHEQVLEEAKPAVLGIRSVAGAPDRAASAIAVCVDKRRSELAG